MTRTARRLRLAAAVLAGALASTAAAVPTRPPNIVIILADDAGHGDFGFTGSRDFATPNLDRLARQSVRYTAAYAAMPFCSPSRAALLTGRYPQRYGYEFNLTQAAPKGVDAAFMGLDTGEQTIADRLRAAGYATVAIGKWHVGSAPQFQPDARGFGEFHGFLGGDSHYLPARVKPGSILANGTPAPPATYLTDELADVATAQLARHRDRPLLLYLAFNAVHTPMEALPEDEARFAGIADPQRRRLAAMTFALDRAIGRVLATIDRLGMANNTLVVFSNDNGGDRIGLGASNAPYRGTKGTLLEGGIRVPLLVRYPGGQPGTVATPVSLMDILPTALDVAGLPAAAGLDGHSLRAPAARPLFWRYDVMAAMRDGRWKLLRFPDRLPQLYDLATDPGERHDRAATHTGQVAGMLKRLFAWEAGLEHPRWHTGSFWSQEDVRRYDEAHVLAAQAVERRQLAPPPPD